jgi:hypothetical protein
MIDRLAAAEEQFLAQEFLAPVLRGGAKVRVRIAGAICEMTVTGRATEGFTVLRPRSHAEATPVRPATMAERRAYLQLFPALRCILTRRDGDTWHASLCAADPRVPNDVPVEVRFVDGADLFDTVVARFDGRSFWFDSLDEQADPRLATYLREQLVRMARPAKLEYAGLTAAHREAYASLHAQRLAAIQADAQTREQRRLGRALAHAGATLRAFTDAGRDAYRVTYDVDGRRHVSVVRKADLTVQVSGICLSGRDRDFDLNSLVGVLREA